LAVRLNINFPGLEDGVKRELAEAAHQICPYSRMTRGHVSVDLKVL
jgi:organic hydroperoxide reductase OsmC/OhrA